MTVQNLSDEKINRLNSACQAFQGSCDLECDKIGWCDACWIAAGGGEPLVGIAVEIEEGEGSETQVPR